MFQGECESGVARPGMWAATGSARWRLSRRATIRKAPWRAPQVRGRTAYTRPAALSIAQPSSGWTMSLWAPDGGSPWLTTALASMLVNWPMAKV